MRKREAVLMELGAWRQLVRDLVGTRRPLDEAEAARAQEWLRSGRGPRPSELLQEIEALTAEVRRLLQDVDDGADAVERLERDVRTLRGMLDSWAALARVVGVQEVARKTVDQVVAEGAAVLKGQRDEAMKTRGEVATLYQAITGRILPMGWERDREQALKDAAAAAAGRREVERERDQAREELAHAEAERARLWAEACALREELERERESGDVLMQTVEEAATARGHAEAERDQARARLVREQEAAALLAAAVDRATATATAAEQARDQATEALGHAEDHARELQEQRDKLRNVLEQVHQRNGMTEESARASVATLIGEEVTDG